MCGTGLRTAYAGTMNFSPPALIADERDWYAAFARRRHPVTLEDYGRAFTVVGGRALKERAERGERVVTFGQPGTTEVIRGRPGHEKYLPDPWVLARFSHRRSLSPELRADAAVAAARRSLGCGASAGCSPRSRSG